MAVLTIVTVWRDIKSLDVHYGRSIMHVLAKKANSNKTKQDWAQSMMLICSSRPERRPIIIRRAKLSLHRCLLLAANACR